MGLSWWNRCMNPCQLFGEIIKKADKKNMLRINAESGADNSKKWRAQFSKTALVIFQN